MIRHTRFRPYVRLANGREKSNSLRIAFRLAIYQEFGRPYYVMVQRGFPNHAIAVGPSKRDVQRVPLPVALGKVSFQQFAQEVQRKAEGKTP